MKKYKKFFGGTSNSQLNSWKNSMQYMRGVLDDSQIPDNSGVAIEFNIPTTSKRIDFILSGRDKNKKDSVIIIELKQWETCSAVEGNDAFSNNRLLANIYIDNTMNSIPGYNYRWGAPYGCNINWLH